MALLATILIFLGFHICYTTSIKLVSHKHIWVKQVQSNTSFFRILGLLLIVFGFYGFTAHFGLATGIFMGLIMLMTIACSIVLLYPLSQPKKK